MSKVQIKEPVFCDNDFEDYKNYLTSYIITKQLGEWKVTFYRQPLEIEFSRPTHHHNSIAISYETLRVGGGCPTCFVDNRPATKERIIDLIFGDPNFKELQTFILFSVLF